MSTAIKDSPASWDPKQTTGEYHCPKDPIWQWDIRVPAFPRPRPRPSASESFRSKTIVQHDYFGYDPERDDLPREWIPLDPPKPRKPSDWYAYESLRPYTKVYGFLQLSPEAMRPEDV